MKDSINGLTKEVADALDGVARAALAQIIGLTDDRLFELVKGLEISVGTDWTAAGVTMTYRLPREVFSSSTALRRGLDEGTREARLVAFGVLGEVDPAAAARLFGETLWLAHENAHAVAYEANLIRNLWAKWQTWMALQPPSVPAELWLAGKFRFEVLTDEQIAAVPADKVHASALKVSPGDLPRVLAIHPALRSEEARVELFHAALANKRRQSAYEVARALIGARYEKRGEIARAYLDAYGDSDWGAVDLVVAARDVPSLERLFALLPARAARSGLAWDPHHADAELRPAIRAGFALDPATASARFATWFEDISTDAQAKVASDIWMLGTGTAVNHDGTHLSTGDGDLLDADPGWMVLAARWVNHPRIGRAAKWLLGRVVDKQKKKELVAEHARPAPVLPIKKSKTTAKTNKRGPT